jgi:aspartate dehydrogenase
VRVVADPAARGNTHEIEAKSAAGEAHFRFVNAPSPDNPKTSMVTALSLAAAVRRVLDEARAR